MGYNTRSKEIQQGQDQVKDEPKNEATGKTKKATKDNRRFDSFIYKEDDGKFYLFHKYWRCLYRGNNLFQCPKCLSSISMEPKIGFVMVSEKDWHKTNKCIISCKQAPKDGHSLRVRYKAANQKGFKFRVEVITNEEVDRKRKWLEDNGYKSKFNEVFPDAICQKEAEINENDENYSEKNSNEIDDTEDSDSDEAAEDS